MLRVERRAEGSDEPVDTLVLPYDDRKKSRLLARSARGVEVAIVLPRGSWLRDGDRLAANSGEVLEVRAADEKVSEVRSSDALKLTRAAYHLGNRHVPLQVAGGVLRYQHDHVLDEMVLGLGLEVVVAQAPFEPEPGAYAHGHGLAQAHGDAPRFRRLR
jgi:urease accessory protein